MFAFVLQVSPYIAILRDGLDNSTNVQIGKPAIYLVHVKLPYGSQTPLSLSVSSGSKDLSICNVRQTAAGFGYPCINQTCPTLYGSNKCASNFTVDSSAFTRNSYNVYLSMITNTGNEITVTI